MINIDVSSTISDLIDKLTDIDKDAMLREIASTMMPLIRMRVHVDGRASDNSQIGTYYPGYIAKRVALYKRSSDPKIILSLTRQMESSMQVVQVADGWGIGYMNAFEYEKAIKNERKYKKVIWNLSEDEIAVQAEIAERYITEKLND